MSGMTTLQQIDLCCPVCATRFRSQAVVATNAFGGKRTDFHERAAGTQPLAYLVHMCNRCGFAGAEREFTDETEVRMSGPAGACAPGCARVGQVRGGGEGRDVAGR
jgi:uncharacterized protein (DUF2225 family)